MKKLLIILVFVVMFVGIVSAVNVCGNDNSFLGTFQLHQNITLRQTCDDCSFVNLSSITYPNATNVNYNLGMDNNGIVYTINFDNNNQLGCYSYVVLGDKAGINTAETIDYQVTVDGKPPQSFPYQFIIIIMGIVLVVVSYMNDRLTLLRYVGGMILMVMGVLTLYPGFGYISWDSLLGKALGFGFIGIGFYFLIEDSFSRKKQSQYYDQGFDETDNYELNEDLFED